MPNSFKTIQMLMNAKFGIKKIPNRISHGSTLYRINRESSFVYFIYLFHKNIQFEIYPKQNPKTYKSIKKKELKEDNIYRNYKLLSLSECAKFPSDIKENFVHFVDIISIICDGFLYHNDINYLNQLKIKTSERKINTLFNYEIPDVIWISNIDNQTWLDSFNNLKKYRDFMLKCEKGNIKEKISNLDELLNDTNLYLIDRAILMRDILKHPKNQEHIREIRDATIHNDTNYQMYLYCTILIANRIYEICHQ